MSNKNVFFHSSLNDDSVLVPGSDALGPVYMKLASPLEWASFCRQDHFGKCLHKYAIHPT